MNNEIVLNEFFKVDGEEVSAAKQIYQNDINYENHLLYHAYKNIFVRENLTLDDFEGFLSDMVNDKRNPFKGFAKEAGQLAEVLLSEDEIYDRALSLWNEILRDLGMY